MAFRVHEAVIEAVRLEAIPHAWTLSHLSRTLAADLDVDRSTVAKVIEELRRVDAMRLVRVEGRRRCHRLELTDLGRDRPTEAIEAALKWRRGFDVHRATRTRAGAGLPAARLRERTPKRARARVFSG